jgi:hypothetical protein
VTVSYGVPSGSDVSRAAGDGWTCQLKRWLVTCTRPGTGKDALAAAIPRSRWSPRCATGLGVPRSRDSGRHACQRAHRPVAAR